MVALDVLYHTQCLSQLYKRAARVKNQPVTQNDEDSIYQGIALAELVSFLEECRSDPDENTVFKLSETRADGGGHFTTSSQHSS